MRDRGSVGGRDRADLSMGISGGEMCCVGRPLRIYRCADTHPPAHQMEDRGSSLKQAVSPTGTRDNDHMVELLPSGLCAFV
jgi:hypothetical protein